MPQDIYKIDERYEVSMETLKADLRGTNYLTVFSFLEYLRSQGASKNTIIKISCMLRISAILSGASLSMVTEDELISLLAKINDMKLSVPTRNSYVLALRRFFKFTLRHKKAKLLKLLPILTYKKCSQVRVPIKVLTQSDIDSIINAAEDDEMKMILSLTWETGARIGEILNLRKQDIVFDEYGAILHLSGKTGQRFIRIVDCTIQLKGFIREEDYIFKMRHHEFSNSLNRIKKKLNLPELYIHLFRKCRSTDLSNYMTQQQLCKYLGWVPDSRMPRHYIFLSNDDANNAVLRMHRMRMAAPQRL